MPGLIIWKNKEISRLKRDMDRLLTRFWDDFGKGPSNITFDFAPVIDLSETEDALVVRAEFPGISPEDIDISVTDHILTIKVEMKQEASGETEGFHSRQLKHGFFTRSLQLPCKVLADEVEATYKKGILSIILPKCKAATTREIKIRIQ
jgi:HSP20 family protein